jgi:N-acetyl-gamma-glutamyl-phosphate reductase
MPTVFIDGQAGTVGLRIRELLTGRADLAVVEVEEARRKDPAARRACFEAADVAVLCLPDDAVDEAVALAEGGDCRVLDASTRNRVSEGWVYGLPELVPGQRAAIVGARRVSNPGCYPTAVVLLLRPLVDVGLVAADAPLAVHALSGYSGGGRSKIERWEDPGVGLVGLPYEAPYALTARHKHMPEMTRYASLAAEPQFVPAVGPFRDGMRVQVPLPAGLLAGRATPRRAWEALAARYRGEPFVEVAPWQDAPAVDERTFDPTALDHTNRIRLHVLGHPTGHALLVGILDNLGKGAAGAAVQNLNLMLGLDETAGLG